MPSIASPVGTVPEVCVKASFVDSEAPAARTAAALASLDERAFETVDHPEPPEAAENVFAVSLTVSTQRLQASLS